MPRGTARAWLSTLDCVILPVTITAPVSGARVSSANVPVSWSFSAPQDQYRIQFYSDEEGDELVFDTEWTASAVQSATVATGSSLVSNQMYWLRMWAHGDDGSEGESELVPFFFALPTSVDVENLRAVGFPECLPSPSQNPAILVSWTAVSPAETFLVYEIRRREAGEEEFIALARIANQATTRYFDYTGRPGATYEYQVLFYADGAGPATLLSAPQDPPARAMVRFDWTYVHEVPDPREFLRVASHEGSVSSQADIAVHAVWGVQKPVAFVGEMFTHVVTLPGFTNHRQQSPDWARYERLLERQTLPAAAGPLCLRMGYDRERYFVVLMPVEKRLGIKTFTPSIRLVEVEYDEDLGLYEHTPGGVP